VGRTEGYNLVYRRRNEDILELKIDTVQTKLTQYKQKWLRHVKKWKTLHNQSNNLNITLSEEDLDNY